MSSQRAHLTSICLPCHLHLHLLRSRNGTTINFPGRSKCCMKKGPSGLPCDFRFHWTITYTASLFTPMARESQLRRAVIPHWLSPWLPETLYSILQAMAELSVLSHTPLMVKGLRLVSFQNTCEPDNAEDEQPKGCDDRRLRIYEAENGSLLFGPFEFHSDWIRSVSWSPDGQRYVSVTLQCISPHTSHAYIEL